MKRIISPEQMRKLERVAFREGIRSIDLMEKAARQVALRAFDMAKGAPALFLCGPGNNGGDGLAAARIYQSMGGHAEACLLTESALPPDAQANLEHWRAIRPLFTFDQAQGQEWALLVDAMFGIGLTRPLEGIYAECATWINDEGSPVLAVDIPSGINARDGSVPGICVQAHHTITFQAMKHGHVFFPGRAHCGEITVADIGLSGDLSEGITSLEQADIPHLLPARKRDAHKGDFGHLLIVAGSLGMAGAAALCARGALKAGAGLVTVACPERSVLPIVQNLAPEAMCLPLPEQDGMITPEAADVILSFKKSVIAIGPGLRVGAGSMRAIEAVLRANVPVVFDADALNCIAQNPSVWPSDAPPAILTPHPGEMARLQGGSCANPIDDAHFLAAKLHATVLLKGASTVIATPSGETAVNLSGTPAMARGGSGDVLTGIIGALLCQKLSLFDAARLGAFLHGKAGESAEKQHGLGFTAMTLADTLWEI